MSTSRKSVRLLEGDQKREAFRQLYSWTRSWPTAKLDRLYTDCMEVLAIDDFYHVAEHPSVVLPRGLHDFRGVSDFVDFETLCAYNYRAYADQLWRRWLVSTQECISVYVTATKGVRPLRLCHLRLNQLSRPTFCHENETRYYRDLSVGEMEVYNALCERLQMQLTEHLEQIYH